MYVFRPQQAPGCGAGHRQIGRSVHNAGRCKFQRRPKAKQRRRLPLPSRRKLQVRDEPGHVAAAPGLWEALGAVHEHLRPLSPENGKRSSVRNRLRSRLVERRTSELVAALVRRHGERWSLHVLQGGFHADESMRRICEAFGLRPDLECQVLQAACERARSSTGIENMSQYAEEKFGASQSLLGIASDEEVPQSMQELSRQTSLESSDVGYYSSAEVSAATSSSAPSPTFGPTEDSENDDVESLGWTLEEVLPADVPTARRAAPQIWRAPWRMRVLSTLGLDRWWSTPRIGNLSTPEELVGLSEVQQQMLEEAGIAEGVEDEDSEDMVLSSKLVAAVLNAERHAASSCGGCDGGSSEADEAQPSSAWQLSDDRRQRSGSRGVQFAESSKVCFFGQWPERSQPGDGYQRSLVTKVFDGPSGHKAKRAREADAESSDADDCRASDQEEEDEEDWEDRCDDIAELMSQQRSMLLWSDSW